MKVMTGKTGIMQTKPKTDHEMESTVAKFVVDVMRNGVGKNIDPARKRTMIAYSSYALTIYDKAFNKSSLQKGWEVAGCYPINPRRMLSKWSQWTRLTPIQGQQALDALPGFAAIIKSGDGRCNDDAISLKLPFLPPCTNAVEVGGISRDRCCVVNAVMYDAARAAAAPEKAAKAAEAKQKATEKQSKFPQTTVTWTDACAFFPKPAVVLQLKLRQALDKNLTFKENYKVDLLRQIWRDFDAVISAVAAASSPHLLPNANPNPSLHPPAM